MMITSHAGGCLFNVHQGALSRDQGSHRGGAACEGVQARGKKENRARHGGQRVAWGKGERKQRGEGPPEGRVSLRQQLLQEAAEPFQGTARGFLREGVVGEVGELGNGRGNEGCGTRGAARARVWVCRLPSGRTSKGRGPCSQGKTGRNKQSAVLNGRAGSI